MYSRLLLNCGPLPLSRARLLDGEVAVAVDRHVSGDRGILDRALHVVGRHGVGDDAAGDLPSGGRIRDEIDETGADRLVGDRLRVRDVAGDVLQGEGLALQPVHRGIHRAEKTHDVFSTVAPRNKPAIGRTDDPGEAFAIRVPERNTRDIRGLPRVTHRAPRHLLARPGRFCRAKRVTGLAEAQKARGRRPRLAAFSVRTKSIWQVWSYRL